MAAPKKRLPGQTNHDVGGRPDPNAGFLGQHSLEGRGSTRTLVDQLRRWLAWRERRRTGGR